MTLRQHRFGAAEIAPIERGVALIVRRARQGAYSNAQLDDHAGLPRAAFPNRPPLTLSLSACFSHDGADDAGGGLRGTAGFGFWNDPFMMSGSRTPALPAALWFFYASPPSDMKLDVDTPGWGWKAATIDARRASAIGPALAAPLLVPLMRLGPVYRRVWPGIQRRLGIAERLAPVRMTEWHRYRIEWGRRRARFLVDDTLLLDAPAPRGPLGLVIWCDNQYMVARPWGWLGHGALETGEQWLKVADLQVREGEG